MHYVLVVSDDEEDSGCLNTAFHTQPGKIRVSCMHSGATAIDFINKSPAIGFPFLIIIDQYLPDIDSLTLLTTFKCSSHSKLIPVAIMSGFATEEIIREYYLAGANCFYKKPIDPPDWNHMADCLLTLFHNY